MRTNWLVWQSARKRCVSNGANWSGIAIATSGRGKHTDHPASKQGGRAHKSGSPEQRTAAARKGWETRRKNQAAKKA